MMKGSKPAREIVVRELAPVNKYRVRILSRDGSAQRTLDIREYVVAHDSFEGYTRRGIRLSDRAQVELLRDILSEVLRDLLI
jgi:hypothetical protein